MLRSRFKNNKMEDKQVEMIQDSEEQMDHSSLEQDRAVWILNEQLRSALGSNLRDLIQIDVTALQVMLSEQSSPTISVDTWHECRQDRREATATREDCFGPAVVGTAPTTRFGDGDNCGRAVADGRRECFA